MKLVFVYKNVNESARCLSAFWIWGKCYFCPFREEPFGVQCERYACCKTQRLVQVLHSSPQNERKRVYRVCVYDINGFTCHIQNLCQLYHITIMKFLGFILYTCAVLFCGCSIRYNFNHLIFFYIISRIILKLSQENCSFVSCLGRAGISHTPCKTATQRECQIYRGEVMLIVLYP